MEEFVFLLTAITEKAYPDFDGWELFVKPLFKD